MGNIDKPTRLRSLTMKPQPMFSPTQLRYIAALRGNKLKRAGTEFTYAEMACRDPQKLVCLAASNPEGRFYGFVADDATRRTSEEMAAQHGTFNVVFMMGMPSAILARIANGSSLPPMLDFLCCDESTAPLPTSERDALYELADKRLKEGGLLTRSYRISETAEGPLKFIIRELAPEMNEAQKLEFLTEIKQLGVLHLAKNPTLDAKLDHAIETKNAKEFFAQFDAGTATSETFATMVAMGSRHMTYAGDATLAANYVELSLPTAAQDIVVKCRENLLYEPIKDFALNRTVRSDIWIKGTQERSTIAAELFGGFAYGVTLAREDVPTSFAAYGKKIDLSAPLYAKLIDLMVTMPAGVGDFLAHPSGKGEKPENVIEALKVLVACGIAHPMRGLLTHAANKAVTQPRLVGSFNRFLDKTNLDGDDVWFASPALGYAIAVPAREAFVMQALNRAGLANSVSALMPELRRIANTTAGQLILQSGEPTTEFAQALVRDVVSKSLPQWYAYALLEAA
jgi:hypothetical protein